MFNANRRDTALLSCAALLMFVPGAWEFLQRGVPAILFTGDGAILELRVRQAAHGIQLMGPYSRFEWSHLGPSFGHPVTNVDHGPRKNR